MSYLHKKNLAESKAKRFLFIVLAISAFLAIVFAVITPPALDENFCPVDKLKIKPHRFFMLIDITSELTNQNKKIVSNIASDWVSGGPSSQMLSIYSLNTANIKDFEDIDTICSPPNALLLGISYGQQKANQRIDKFKARIREVVDKASRPNSQLTSSKILESVMQITNGPNWLPGTSRLIMVSDLIEKSDAADFYAGNIPKFSDWVAKQENKGLVNSIKMTRGDRVQICQVLTEKPGYQAREQAAQFWLDLFAYKGVSEVFFACSGIAKD
ncbi:hypothetical protein G6675_04040 [Polynucleobacter paneuropaeus]|jgi:hypothetical protein|nr:hypothetical protein [Polynucleobacter paneuropaeus]MBT8576017.1 hypothetical protein [Polynucleobacter paneuropaeus]MBT8587452.1 hypothetical protein [Polynucleobacter paneuropaeus]MBT8600120.1 hypothetical protein [Polynucleobacter paneuropaeus]MBT8604541.1 hypothetical protein [Polynucleobacter paneuropaeus]